MIIKTSIKIQNRRKPIIEFFLVAKKVLNVLKYLDKDSLTFSSLELKSITCSCWYWSEFVALFWYSIDNKFMVSKIGSDRFWFEIWILLDSLRKCSKSANACFASLFPITLLLREMSSGLSGSFSDSKRSTWSECRFVKLLTSLNWWWALKSHFSLENS